MAVARITAKYWLLRLDAVAEVTTDAGKLQAKAGGELILQMAEGRGTVLKATAARFALAVASVRGTEAPTGTITILGCCSSGTLEQRAGRTAKLKLEVEAKLNDEHIDAKRVPVRDKGCYYTPAFEPCVAHVEAQLSPKGRGWHVQKGELRVVCAAGDVGQVRLIQIELKGDLIPLPGYNGDPVVGPASDANSPYDPCISTTRRRLIIQPVIFRNNAMDMSPTGTTAAAQFATAQTVWNKACIDIDVRAAVTIDNATLKTSSDLTAIRASHTDSDPNVIEVYFVANSLSATGGGNAGAIGVASCKVVVAEPNGGNPVLVSHELGHVLGLQHPGAGSNSDAGTVMTPTGSAMVAGTQLVTHHMCTSIANPVLQTSVTACCLSHDKGDHFIRDFPVDSGSEPSDPLPAGMTRYSMSNVWNRLSTTPGSINAATGPEHQSPARFAPDMSPKINFLFARVEVVNNLAIRDALVKFYLKTPGSGGGGAGLSFLGQIPVPAALAFGVPQNVQLPWLVPAGSPSHSCVFAVVTSPSEPEGAQTGLDWAQFEDLAYRDNDWAQRNLDIIDVSSSNLGDGSSNTVESAPWLIRMPARRDTDGLVLEIDATGAKASPALEVELLGIGQWKIKPGGKVTIKPKLQRRTESVVVLIRAGIPRQATRDDEFTVLVNPQLGKTPLVGFGTTFRISHRAQALEQLFDRVLAAFTDWAMANDSDAACRLLGAAKRLFLERPCEIGDVADHARAILRESLWEQERHASLSGFGVRDVVQAAAQTVASGTAADAIEMLRRVAQRLHLAASQTGRFPAYLPMPEATPNVGASGSCSCHGG